jgi:hypothetical protein
MGSFTIMMTPILPKKDENNCINETWIVLLFPTKLHIYESPYHVNNKAAIHVFAP